MEKIIYAKYNNTRRPQFQTKTLITEQDGQRRVKKLPLVPEAEGHVGSFADKKSLADRLYKNMQVTDVSCGEDGSAVFPFIHGETVGSMLEAELNSLDATLDRMKNYIKRIDDYEEEMTVDFRMSKEFAEVFGELSYQGKAVKAANIDEILDNFLWRDGEMVLIDYEWVFSFPVPVRYIQFRTIFYFFAKNYSIITQKMDEAAFLAAFGYDAEETAIWKQIEDHFQEYVHGKDRCYMYPVHYEKEIHDINYLMNHVTDVGGELARTKEELQKNKQLLEKKLGIGLYRDFLRYVKQRRGKK